eukprot:CAMPEP_0117659938 /NCGR_PEP_ID=MMETSP0804-20121206/6697_1 /TAXON_ID=1074897 /ORGANISM="Tetraselmis astigmatica, Strain CCMP880" /LENGTH=95 /DNA_ID=CAMNT_0005466625 /DNA_START=999 /DNA_END=1286 /DNA_ORIENTATION=-
MTMGTTGGRMLLKLQWGVAALQESHMKDCQVMDACLVQMARHHPNACAPIPADPAASMLDDSGVEASHGVPVARRRDNSMQSRGTGHGDRDRRTG